MKIAKAFLSIAVVWVAGCDTNQQQTLDNRGDRLRTLTRDPSSGTVNLDPLPAALDFSIDLKEDEMVKGYRFVAKESLIAGIHVEIVTAPKSLQFFMDADGLATVIPNPDFNGTDQLTYRFKSPSGESNTATGTFKVVPVNDKPTAVAIELNGREDESVTVDVLKAVADVDTTDVLKIVKVLTPPTNGVAAINEQGTAISYRPAINFFGRDTFRAQVSDGQDGGLVEVQVLVNLAQVNDAPVAEADRYSAIEDTDLVVAASNGVLRNDIDADGDSLKVAIVTPPARGTLTLNESGAFTYRPLLNSNLPVKFRYKVTDATGLVAEAEAEIEITPVNDAPVAVADSVALNENTAVTIDVLANDRDVENDALQVVVLRAPLLGTLVPLPNSKAFSYTPGLNRFGADSFLYLVKDSANASSEPANVSINIQGVPSPPIVRPDVVSVRSDQTVMIEALANDDDPDASSNANLNIETVQASGEVRGEIQLDATRKRLRFVDVGGRRDLTSSRFDYRVIRNNGADTKFAVGSITVNILANNKPVANNVDIVMDEDSTREFNLADAAFSTDADRDPITVKMAELSAPLVGSTLNVAGTRLSFRPPQDFFTASGQGPLVIRYQVNDGREDSSVAQINIRVNTINDAPVPNALLAQDSFTVVEDQLLLGDGTIGAHEFDVLANDFDVDGPGQRATKIVDGSLRLLVGSSPSTVPGTISIVNNRIRYVGRENFNGDFVIEYKAKDDANAESVDFIRCLVTVVARNDAPVAVEDGAGSPFEVAEDNATGVLISVLNNDRDVDAGDVLTIMTVQSTAKGVATIVEEGRKILYRPRADVVGADVFEYTVRDASGAVSAPAAVNINIIPVNDAPVAVADINLVARRGVITDFAVLGNDNDVDGDTLFISSISQQPRHGHALISGGVIRYFAPQANNFLASDSFRYRVSDGQLESESAEVVITLADSPYSRGVFSIVPEQIAQVSKVSIVARPSGDATRAVVFSGAPSLSSSGATQIMASTLDSSGEFDASVFGGVITLGDFSGIFGVGVKENAVPHSVVVSAVATSANITGEIAVNDLSSKTQLCRKSFEVNNEGQESAVHVSRVFSVTDDRVATAIQYKKDSNQNVAWRIFVFDSRDCKHLGTSAEMSGEFQGMSSLNVGTVLACEKVKTNNASTPDLSCSLWSLDASTFSSNFTASKTVATDMHSLQSFSSVSITQVLDLNLYVVMGKLLDSGPSTSFELAAEFFDAGGTKVGDGVTLPELQSNGDKILWSNLHRLIGQSYDLANGPTVMSVSTSGSTTNASRTLTLKHFPASGGNKIQSIAVESNISAIGESRGDVMYERKSKRVVSVGHARKSRLSRDSAGVVTAPDVSSVVVDGRIIVP